MSILTSSQRMGTAALFLAISIFVSRFMGLIRDKVISYYYGAGIEADIYLASFVAPDFINYLLAGGYFTITLIPVLSRRFKESEDSGWAFFSAVFWWVSVTSAVCVTLAWIYAPLLAKITAPGFAAYPAHMERLTYFLRIVLPAQVFFLPGACLTALLYWRRQFTPPALMPLIYNGCIIIGGAAMANINIARGMEGFCWGVVAGAFIGAFALPFAVARKGGLRLRVQLSDRGLKTFLYLSLPLMLGQSIAVLDEQFIRVFGSFVGAGGVSLLAYARRFMFVPIGIVAQAAGAASYPFLATLAADGEKDRFAETVNNVLRGALSVAVPLCIWMVAIAEPLIRLLFEQGRFTSSDTRMCAFLLSLMLPGVLFWVVHQIVSRSFFAYEDTLTPAVAGTVTTILFLPVYWGLSKLFGAPGVAVAGVLGIGAYTLTMVYFWRKRQGGAALDGLVPFIAKAVGIAGVPGIVTWVAAQRAATWFPGSPLLGAAVALAVASLIYAAMYLPLARFFAPYLLNPLITVYGKVVASLAGR